MKHMARDRFQISKFLENFASWKQKMTLYFRLNIDTTIAIKEGYDLPINDNDNLIPLFKLTKEVEGGDGHRYKRQVSIGVCITRIRHKQDQKVCNNKGIMGTSHRDP